MHAFVLLWLFALLAALPTMAQNDDDSGCIMDAGTPLMECLGSWASLPPLPSATGLGPVEGAQELCDSHTHMADCWAEGLYCPDKFCALAALGNSSSASTTIATEIFSSVSAEASQVITSIWNNDSGTDIPSITNDLNSTQTRPTWTHASSSDAAWPSATATGAVGNGAIEQEDRGNEGGSGGFHTVFLLFTTFLVCASMW